MLRHQDHFLRASCQHRATFEKLGNGVSNGIFIGFMKLDAQHTSPVLPSLATKYFHLLLVSFWASLPSARLLPQRGLLVELECNYQSFELRKLSRFFCFQCSDKRRWSKLGAGDSSFIHAVSRFFRLMNFNQLGEKCCA